MKSEIAALGKGESYVRCRRLPMWYLTRDKMTEEISSLKNTVNSAMRRAAEEDVSAEYTLDNMQIITPTRDVMLLAVVTRTA